MNRFFAADRDQHYLRVGQITIAVVLLLSIAIAWGSTSLSALTTNMITFNTFFGAVVFLLFFWLRLTVPAILAGFIIWMLLWLASAVVPGFPRPRRATPCWPKPRIVTDNIARVAKRQGRG